MAFVGNKGIVFEISSQSYLLQEPRVKMQKFIQYEE